MRTSSSDDNDDSYNDNGDDGLSEKLTGSFYANSYIYDFSFDRNVVQKPDIQAEVVRRGRVKML